VPPRLFREFLDIPIAASHALPAKGESMKHLIFALMLTPAFSLADKCPDLAGRFQANGKDLSLVMQKGEYNDFTVLIIQQNSQQTSQQTNQQTDQQTNQQTNQPTKISAYCEDKKVFSKEFTFGSFDPRRTQMTFPTSTQDAPAADAIVGQARDAGQSIEYEWTKVLWFIAADQGLTMETDNTVKLKNITTRQSKIFQSKDTESFSKVQ
jgi:hypothetical protein